VGPAGSNGEAGCEWYRSAFGDLYPLLYPHRDDDSAAREAASLVVWLDLNDRRARIVDLGCGAGRHAAALAALGLRVVGLDLSNELLERARARTEHRPTVVRGDLRRLPFREAFDLVLSLFTSFGYFDDAGNERALREMARLLVPGGRLVIDHIHAAHLRRALVPEDTREGPGYRIRQRREIVDGRVRKTIVVERDTGEHATLHEDVRLYDPDEMRALVKRAGLTRVSFHGSFDGAALRDDDPRMIVVAHREAA
jgi:SAM-dependent methyltransferase